MKKILSAGFFAAAFIAAIPGCASTNKTDSPKPLSVAANPVRLGAKEIIAKAVQEKTAPLAGEGWQAMFDGKTLAGWRVTPFGGSGEVEIQSGVIVLGMGSSFSGIGWTNKIPTMNYEVALDALRADGSDFFCGLTFPVGDSFCSLICGGWGGSLVGLSSVDGMDASENETTKFVNFEKGRWYRIRLRVTQSNIQAWIDEKELIDLETTGRKISLRPGEIEMSKPFGIASWETTAALREIKLRSIENSAVSPKQLPSP